MKKDRKTRVLGIGRKLGPLKKYKGIVKQTVNKNQIRNQNKRSEPRSNEPLSEEESIPSSESDNDGGMAQPNPPPVVERGPSIRLPWFTGKEDERVKKTLGN